MVLAERNRQVAALRDRDASSASACGRSANFAAISRLRQEILLRREAARPARVGEHVAFGDAHARFVRAEILARSGTGSDASRRSAAPSSLGERDGRLHQRIVVGVARTLHLEVSSASGNASAHSLAQRLARRGVALQQRLPDVAVARAGQRDEAVGALVEPRAVEFAHGRDADCVR